MGVKVELKLAFDGTQTDFLLQVWSGTGGTQYIYGNSLDAADWGWLVGWIKLYPTAISK
jgi:hypothetical protein